MQLQPAGRERKLFFAGVLRAGEVPDGHDHTIPIYICHDYIAHSLIARNYIRFN